METSVVPEYPTIKQLGPKEWENIESVKWKACDKQGTVQPGFKSDFASTPRALWAIFPPMGKYSIAALVHDNLYRYNKYERKLCDQIFLALMIELGVAKWSRQSMYRAVRMFGSKPYKSGPTR